MRRLLGILCICVVIFIGLLIYSFQRAPHEYAEILDAEVSDAGWIIAGESYNIYLKIKSNSRWTLSTKIDVEGGDDCFLVDGKTWQELNRLPSYNVSLRSLKNLTLKNETKCIGNEYDLKLILRDVNWGSRDKRVMDTTIVHVVTPYVVDEGVYGI